MSITVLLASHGLFLSGLARTVYLSAITITTSTLVGMLVGFLRAARPPGLRIVLRIYVEFFRGSPLLVQLLFIYFGAAYIGIRGVNTLIGAVAGLTLYEGAIASEIFRAGVEAVPRAQREAARMLGLGPLDTALRVLLPQAFRIISPALVGQEISLVKDTSLAAIIGFPELINQSQAVMGNVGEPMIVFTIAGALYFIICYPMSVLSQVLERKRPK